MNTLLQDLFEQTVRESGVDPNTADGKTLQEMLQTTVKLARDQANLGELKLVSRSYRELRYALKVFRPYQDTRKISIFGSARTPENHPDYLQCVAFARAIAEKQWMVITGAGDGIMKAGHDGAERDKSFGVSIRLPFESIANEIIAGDDKLITFRYFFTRKLVFMWMSHAVALFPGGFGTQDEGFEALTLIQTGKAPMMPIVLVDHPGGDYWQHWLNYVEHSLLDNQWISPEDMSLFARFTDADAAVDHILAFYKNYHSERFIKDRHVLRIKQPITEERLDELNTQFADLVKEGAIEQSLEPLPEERGGFPKLARLHFLTHKRNYGRLRQLIDAVNI